MKRSTAGWTTAVAASALLAMPVGSWAQQTPSTTPHQQTTAPAPQSGRTPGADTQSGAANEHLRQAQTALADIPAASLTGTTKTRVAELKKHINALEQSASKSSGTSAKANTNWSKDVAAADRILSELLGADGTTGAGAPATAGTSGSTATAPKTTTGSKSSTSMTLDEPARTKLQEVRTQLTAFAASMSGSASAPMPSSDDPSASASASASAAAPASATAAAPAPAGTSGTSAAAPAPTGTSGTTPATATPSEPAATPATPADPAAASAASAQTPQSPASTAAAPSATPSQQVDADTVKKHLSAARDSLSQLTQLPAAAQLTGDARTQISQLISNFNELITTNVDWRSSYAKVQGNLDALMGSQPAQEATTAAATPAPAGGTPGAVGTSGTTTIDPAVRAKLTEFRSHLMDFEKAAGGAPASSASAAPAASSPAASASASPSASASASPAADPSAASASTTSASPAPASASPSASTSASTSSSTASASATPTGTSGSASQEPATAGTSGTGTPMPASDQAPATKPATSSAQASEGHREAMSHIDAIESIVGKSGKSSLDSAKVDEIRTHLKKLREELNKK